MSQEERIVALEKELGELRATFREYALIHQEIGGEARMYEGATLALIETHPRADLLSPRLLQTLREIEANAVSAAETEQHLQGVQDAQSDLISALEKNMTAFSPERD
jgi:hypothetical protein